MGIKIFRLFYAKLFSWYYLKNNAHTIPTPSNNSNRTVESAYVLYLQTPFTVSQQTRLRSTDVYYNEEGCKICMYDYYIPDGETKIQAETFLWVAHLTQPVCTESLFYLTYGNILPLLHCMCGWLARWAR
jgi:hypothetical protein